MITLDKLAKLIQHEIAYSRFHFNQLNNYKIEVKFMIENDDAILNVNFWPKDTSESNYKNMIPIYWKKPQLWFNLPQFSAKEFAAWALGMACGVLSERKMSENLGAVAK